MTETASVGFHGKSRLWKYRWILFVGIPLGAILFQVYIPRFVEQLAYLELPLLLTLYVSMMRRSPVLGVGFGATMGLAQDSLSHNPLGMFGIVKTLVGYFAAFVSQRFDIDNPLVRFSLALFFVFFHQLLYWVMTRALLGVVFDFDPKQAGVESVLNAAVAVPLFHILDRLKINE